MHWLTLMNRSVILAFTLAVLAVSPAPAHAYIGPGGGLSALGALLALLAAVSLAVMGFLWYPIKRMMRRRRAQPSADRKGDSGP